MITVKRAILKTASSDSVLGGNIRGVKTQLNEFHERRILQDFDFFPHSAWNRQGKETHDVRAQSVWFLKEAGSHCIVRAAQMQDYKNDEDFLLGGHPHLRQIGTGMEDARQFRLRVHAFPEIAMLLGQLDEIPNATGACFKQNSEAGKKEPRRDRARLHERKPIVTHPVRKGHDSIISNLPVASFS